MQYKNELGVLTTAHVKIVFNFCFRNVGQFFPENGENIGFIHSLNGIQHKGFNVQHFGEFFVAQNFFQFIFGQNSSLFIGLMWL